jgi:hypothetical protein
LSEDRTLSRRTEAAGGIAFTERTAVGILQRAAEIDVCGGDRVDAERLRAVAAEAGISSAAVEQALREHEAAARLRAWRRRWAHRGLMASLAAAGLWLALVTAMALGAFGGRMSFIAAIRELLDLNY